MSQHDAKRRRAPGAWHRVDISRDRVFRGLLPGLGAGHASSTTTDLHIMRIRIQNVKTAYSIYIASPKPSNKPTSIAGAPNGEHTENETDRIEQINTYVTAKTRIQRGAWPRLRRGREGIGMGEGSAEYGFEIIFQNCNTAEWSKNLGGIFTAKNSVLVTRVRRVGDI